MENININNLFKSNIRTPTNTGLLDIYTLFNPKKNKYKFSVDNLINVRKQRKKKVLYEYNKYFNICLKKIEEENKSNKYDMIYIIPLIVYDCPDYVSSDCIEYINKKLQDLYMDTLILSNKSIFISWNNIELNKKHNKQ